MCPPSAETLLLQLNRLIGVRPQLTIQESPRKRAFFCALRPAWAHACGCKPRRKLTTRVRQFIFQVADSCWGTVQTCHYKWGRSCTTVMSSWPPATATMRLHDSLDTCLLEVLEQATIGACVARPTKNPRQMAPSGSFFGQVLLLSNMFGQTGQKFTTVHMSLFAASTTMGYRSGENCNANLPEYHLPMDAMIFNL